MPSLPPDGNKNGRVATFANVGSTRGWRAQRHACKFADRPACSTLLALECEGRRRPRGRGCGGGYKLHPLLLQPRTAPPILRSAASRPRGARAPRCERWRPTIVYEMIMVARYEVAGLREAVRHLDWPVGSYKRREARADDAIMLVRRASMSEAGARLLLFRAGRCPATLSSRDRLNL